MKGVHFLISTLAILAFATFLASAYDPSPLQDFCVAINDTKSPVLEGTLYVGFVTSNGDGNRLFTKVLNKGDVFVFPIGLIHFQLNVGHVKAVALAALSSQNPGVITIANAVFGSKPPINPDVLAKAFQVDNKVVNYLQKQFWYNNS
ncbi:germin-like protein subfamily 1 member 20 [Prunus yedoensis var. nudiflora]|uniref:Germin-like protein n=1 Tax=Prunus yedoensis var. nudiflora TaxID=2094558 RepID=A0A314U9G0_PRUYE|nr:germin-like protein subfamily 1 member 20 [Prunus yedoensis var. nudiflora]PQM42413.1 germin-like protein subfamily 1 member 20 [Prunus yedoensis var. nudiflora]